MADHPQTINYEHGKIFIATLSQLDVLSFLPFPLFYSFVHFPIHSVFLNKALQVFDDEKDKMKKNENNNKI
jgi:hypothetical protein